MKKPVAIGAIILLVVAALTAAGALLWPKLKELGDFFEAENTLGEAQLEDMARTDAVWLPRRRYPMSSGFPERSPV